VIVFIDTPLAVINARRATNAREPVRRHIEDEVFARHRDRFQFPGEDEPVARICNDGDLADWLSWGWQSGCAAGHRA
jgi:hypothetical protein